MNACSSDDLLGPVVSGCRDNFDFTLFFEQIILSIVPSTIFLLLAPIRLTALVRSSIKTIPNVLSNITVITSLVLVGLQLGLLIVWSNQPATRASIAAATLSFIDSLAILALTSFGSRHVRPISLLTLYLLSSTAFNVVELRTLYLRAESSQILGFSTAIVAVKTILLLLEMQGRRKWLRAPYHKYSPEATSGVIDRGLFWWLNPLMRTGFKKILSLDDLYETDPAIATDLLKERMQKAWNKYSSTTKWQLLRASVWCFRRELIAFAIPRTILIGFNYAQPFLISRVVEYIGQPVDKSNQRDGYGLIGAAFLIYVGLAIASVQYQHKLFRTVTMFRGGVVSLIYSKSLKVDPTSHSQSEVLTLMSTDIERIAFSFDSLSQIWAYVIEIAIGLFLLERQVGWICFAPIVVVGLGVMGATLVSRYVVGAQRAWMEAIQKRIAITSPVLNSMKAVKMMGLSSTIFSRLQNHRIRELHLSAKFRGLSTWRIVLSQFPLVAGPFVVFVIYAIQASIRGTNGIDVSQAFASLAVITLMTGPAGSLVQAIPSIGLCNGCLMRIEKFLQTNSWEDQRQSSAADSHAEREDERSQPSHRVSKYNAIVLENVSLKPGKDAELAIRGLTLHIAEGSFVMITGPVGCGKTTLMRGILGETACETGSIRTLYKEIGYCSQTPWLQNGTFQQIVCGTKEELDIDQEWYVTTIHACALDEDVGQLSNGHDTEIGTRGVTLSGGQKQRLALARAVYARKSVLLLDDVLSALDNTTEQLVIDRLLGPLGLLKKLNTTIVMSGHAWRPMHLADNIIVMQANGAIRAQGKLDELQKSGNLNDEVLRADGVQQTDVKSDVVLPVPKALKGPTANDIADLNRQTGDLSLYLYYIKAIGPKIALIMVFCVAFCAVSLYFPQVWIKWYATGVVREAGVFCGLYVVLLFIALGSLYTSAWLFYCIGIPKSGARLHEILLKATLDAPQSFFDKTDSGVILNRFSQDMTLIDGELPASALITLQAAMNVLVLVALVAAGSSFMGLTIPLIMAALYVLQKLYLRTSRQIRFLDLEAKSPLFSHVVETLEGLEAIRAFGWQSRFSADFEARLDVSQKPYYLMYCIQRWLNLALGLIIGAMAVLVIALSIAVRSSTNSGSLGVALNGILSLDVNFQYLMMFWTSLETSLGAVARTRSFERETPSEISSEQYLVPPQTWPSDGKIEFSDVEARYNTTSVPAISIPSLSLDPFSKNGIIGRTGCGKSTLLSVITGLLPLSAGEILIDDLPMSRIHPNTIRERLVTIPQDSLIIPGLTVRENVDMVGSSTDEDIITCLTKVGLWDKLLARGGLDADMSGLSQGEGQVFALARALLRKRSQHGILLLDEATSNTDHETDSVMSNFIRTEFANWTVIMIAHRLDSVRKGCDFVVRLDRGTVVQSGRVDEVIKHDEIDADTA